MFSHERVRCRLYLLLVFSFCEATAATFTNPLLPSGADPAVVSQGGMYYYMQTTGKDLTIWKTRDVTDLQHAEKKVVWKPQGSGRNSRDIWAPELHYLRGKWYIYFAADAGKNESHRIWVLENAARDPLEGSWKLKGKLDDGSDKWAIDATVFEDKGRLYALWSGWAGDVDGEQDIYIARLRNPWTISGKRVRISRPDLPWERFGDLKNPVRHVDVNEGPEMLQHNGRLFLIYSASGCWTDHYALGMLSAASGSDLLDPASWKKSPEPVFTESPESHAFGTGHNTFFRSPDGQQDWIIYHANPASGQGCGVQRSPRAQRFTWKADGSPNFGEPLPLDTPIEKPSGTKQ